MSLRLRLPVSGRLISARPHALSNAIPLCVRLRPMRSYAQSEKPPPQDQKATGPNQDVLPHVSEEASMTGKITGEGGPELEQGTPIQEVLEQDSEAKKNAPKVIKDDIKAASVPKGTRPFSTLQSTDTPGEMDVLTSNLQTATMSGHTEEHMPSEMQKVKDALASTLQTDGTQENTKVAVAGHKFGLPELPLPKGMHLKHRYDPLVEQTTNMMMRDGKKATAQRNMDIILAHLRTAPPPMTDPRKPLLPGAPPPSHLPLNPILYLTLAIDSLAPLLRIRSQRGAAGGGVALQIPIPLTLRQRRRQALEWILDAARKRPFRGSGRGGFAKRVAEEIVAVVEGRSSAWEKRSNVHRLGVAGRTNLLRKPRKFKISL